MSEVVWLKGGDKAIRDFARGTKNMKPEEPERFEDQPTEPPKKPRKKGADK